MNSLILKVNQALFNFHRDFVRFRDFRGFHFPISLFSIALALLASIPTASAGVPELSRRYSRDDGLLGRAIRYERTENETRQQLWALETGEVVKVATHTKTAQAETTDEYSLDADGAVYFVFHRVLSTKADGGARVTEDRAYYEASQAIQFSRRTAELPPGAAPEIPAKILAEKLDLEKLTEEQSDNNTSNDSARAVIEAIRTPECLIHDPAKEAQADWRRIKLIEGSLSPDGRYALAWAPAKKDFDWKNYVAEEETNDYWVEPESEPVVNFMADLKTHTVLGRVPGVHFGVRRNYNHYECITVWSPDSSIFIELNTRKWDYAACFIGRLSGESLGPVEDLGVAAELRSRQLLKTIRHAGYLKHSEQMAVALDEPEIKNDGTGSVKVVFQVPKSDEDDAYATVRVRFRLTGEKKRLETTAAALMKEE